MTWGTENIGFIIASLLEDLWNSLVGNGIYAGFILLFGLLIVALELIIKKWTWLVKAEYSITVLACVIGMIALNIVMGRPAPPRARLATIYSTAFFGMLAVSIIASLSSVVFKNVLITMSMFSIFVSAMMQSKELLTLFYTDEICNKQQYEVGSDILRNVRKLGYDLEEEKVVIYVGYWKAPLNESCKASGGQIGHSSFEVGYDGYDVISGSRNSNLYMNAAFGTYFTDYINSEDKERVLEKVMDMPSYPIDGYVDEVEGIIVVKLSDIR